MSFGITGAGVISRTTTNTVETAQKTDEDGVILEETSYGGVEEVTEESFSDAITNAALNGQTGTTASGITVEDTFVESNDAYARQTTRVRAPLAVAA